MDSIDPLPIPDCDDSLEDSDSLPDPHLLAQEIADDLRSALEQIEDILADPEQRVSAGAGGIRVVRTSP